MGVEHKKEIEGFHLPTASLRLSAQQVIKEAANRVPLIKTNLHPEQMEGGREGGGERTQRERERERERERKREREEAGGEEEREEVLFGSM